MPVEGVVKLSFDGCALGILGQLRIGGVIIGHQGLVMKTYSKPTIECVATEVEVVVVEEGLVQIKALGMSNFVVEEKVVVNLMGG